MTVNLNNPERKYIYLVCDFSNMPISVHDNYDDCINEIEKDNKIIKTYEINKDSVWGVFIETGARQYEPPFKIVKLEKISSIKV